MLDLIQRIQERNAPRHRPAGVRRTFHVKTIAGARAELRILSDVPERLRHGLFAVPKIFPAVVRLSSAQSWEQPDWIPDARGFSVRVLSAPGPFVDGSVQDVQDFLAINGNVRFFGSVEIAAKVMPLMESMVTLPFRAIRAMPLRALAGLGFDFAAIAARTFHCLSVQNYYCASPIAVGGAGAGKAWFRATKPLRRGSSLFGNDGLRTSFDSRLADENIVFELMVQPFIDESVTPIEDLSVGWSESKAPSIKVGELVMRRRDAAAAIEMREMADSLAFSPWNALEAHRPLGRIQLMRREAYLASALRRSVTPAP